MGCASSASAVVAKEADYEIITKPSAEPKPVSAPRPSASRKRLQIRPSTYLATTYNIREAIGQGAYGTVCLADARATDEVRAIKVLAVSRKEALVEAEQEAQMWWLSQRHPNVVELLECFKDPLQFFMVMEYCSGGTLSDRRSVFYKYPEHVIGRLFKEMMESLAFVHAAGVVHRDIKPANFLLGGADGKTIKLCDFGLAAMTPKFGKLYGCYGTPAYMSPEMASKTGHSASTDVWSLGATCYTMVMCEYPYGAAEALGKTKGEALKISIAENLHPPTFQRAAITSADPKERANLWELEAPPSTSLLYFLRILLHRDPQTRITASQALDLCFLQQTSDIISNGAASETILHLTV